MITHIYFDWSGTLAKKDSKKILISGTLQEKKATLFSETIPILQYLNKKGYILGIISNTSKDITQLEEALKEIDIYKYFKGAIIFTVKNMCKKPCKEIFNIAMEKDKVHPSKYLMVGDKYKNDILGAKSAGMFTCLVDRESKNLNKKENIDIHIYNLTELKLYL